MAVPPNIETLQYAFTALGVYVVATFALSVLGGVWARLLRPGKNLKKYGQWAVVTGATDGIGLAMATQFAKSGLNIVLISRSADKLKTCAEEIAQKYPKIQVKVLDVDYSSFDETARTRVAEFLKELDVGVLVNNVGISYPYTRYFYELEDENVEQLITLNVNSTTWMTRIVLPGMVARKRGAIVNMASAAGVLNSPLLAQYGAAKSYIAMFSKTLNYELAGKGIHVQCQVPLFVATKLAKIRKASLMTASPSGYARAAVAAIGYEAVVSPYWSHALQMWIMQTMPEFLSALITFNMHAGIRKAGMKKDERLAKEKAN